MKTKKFYQRALSFVLALAMLVTVFSVSSPAEVEAAATKSFKSKGSSSVTISDDECYDATGEIATHYIKFKAGETGFLTLKFSNASQLSSSVIGGVRICKSSKQPIGKSEIWTTGYSQSVNFTRTYGVKKGVTYNFEVFANYGTKINATFKKVKKVNATKRTKAKEIKKGKTMTGVIIAGDKKADWYKIKLKNSKKLKITCNVKTNGLVLGTDGYSHDGAGIVFTYYDGKGNVFDKKNPSDILTPLYPKQVSTLTLKSSSGATHTLSTGTYYIKVEPYNTSSSGQYTIKWTTY